MHKVSTLCQRPLPRNRHFFFVREEVEILLGKKTSHTARFFSSRRVYIYIYPLAARVNLDADRQSFYLGYKHTPTHAQSPSQSDTRGFRAPHHMGISFCFSCSLVAMTASASTRFHEHGLQRQALCAGISEHGMEKGMSSFTSDVILAWKSATTDGPVSGLLRDGLCEDGRYQWIVCVCVCSPREGLGLREAYILQ